MQELGGKVVTCSDSSGYIYDPEGIDVKLLKEVKEINRQRLTEYANQRPSAIYHAGESVWTLKEKADIALPCATQNEIDESLAEILVENGIKIVAEGANMPCTVKAVSVLHEAGVWYCPGKAANAGGVAVSALEMSQNVQRLTWEESKWMSSWIKSWKRFTIRVAKQQPSTATKKSASWSKCCWI